ncbi:hypothetical protein JX265_013726 [Neoarthrinium moseri]|uniref:Protein kinase domain-containing protein n=1 Tax=Neoarthrinium moseri TaxID=1658444 RepID=A0A9P9W7V2_9PEZI|nr:hypothetical protein JX265_013726 [Neoarthrinium moseri]
MQTNKVKAEALGRKAKLANSYQELLDEFSNKDLKNVGNYGLGKLIGKGSFGKVYLAHHKLTNGSKVVLKSAKKDDSNLAREIHHHRQFVHPHIARLYEVIVTESMVWLVLEYCAGDELYNYLLKHGPLPVEKVQKTFTQLVGAVSYVHQQSCVHRDLKLENILLDKHENVKLVDFGFTREYEGKSNYLQTFCGTICYSAPEMLKGEKYAGEKVDVWSLGVILYALLCGELPFDDDDDNITRTRILSEEPKYPEHLPTDAIGLIKLLLSKRPLLRPTLPDILQHPFLSEHAPQQQAILKLRQPAPFSTALEKDCLERMRHAGVDIDQVIESVLAQKCDALAGWWTLLLEKEERKSKRRERRRKEKEAENRNSRRFSGASGKLERMAPILDEDGVLKEPPLPRARGRSERRSAHYADFNVTELPNLPEMGKLSPETEMPPTPIDKDSIRSASTSRHRRPIPPPKEGILRSARSRGSTLHLVTTSDALGLQPVPPNPTKVKKKPSQVIIGTWKNWTHWLVDTTRRHKPNKRGSQSTPNLVGKNGGTGDNGKNSKNASPRPHTSKYPTSASGPAATTDSRQANGHAAKGSPGLAPGNSPNTPTSAHYPTAPSNVQRMPSSTSYKRQSLSPGPMTPRSSVRRSSTGLRGRKSTSSSLSSIRTMPPHHHHSHSKASSTSSNGSVSTSKTPLGNGRSPHHSVKVLPATPTATSFPSNIRFARGPSLTLNFNEGMPSYDKAPAPGSPSPFSINNAGPSVLFAKRKRNIFKGPMLQFGNQAPSASGRSREGSHSRNVSASGLGRRSGEITIQEEDEEAVEEEEADRGQSLDLRQRDLDEESIEEVDQFSPIIRQPGEKIEEIYEGEGEGGGVGMHEPELAGKKEEVLLAAALFAFWAYAVPLEPVAFNSTGQTADHSSSVADEYNHPGQPMIKGAVESDGKFPWRNLDEYQCDFDHYFNYIPFTIICDNPDGSNARAYFDDDIWNAMNRASEIIRRGNEIRRENSAGPGPPPDIDVEFPFADNLRWPWAANYRLVHGSRGLNTVPVGRGNLKPDRSNVLAFSPLYLYPLETNDHIWPYNAYTVYDQAWPMPSAGRDFVLMQWVDGIAMYLGVITTRGSEVDQSGTVLLTYRWASGVTANARLARHMRAAKDGRQVTQIPGIEGAYQLRSKSIRTFFAKPKVIGLYDDAAYSGAPPDRPPFMPPPSGGDGSAGGAGGLTDLTQYPYGWNAWNFAVAPGSYGVM